VWASCEAVFCGGAALQFCGSAAGLSVVCGSVSVLVCEKFPASKVSRWEDGGWVPVGRKCAMMIAIAMA
jgi:hypothetical protein